MRIVVDLQSAQTASRFRGIGRYSLSLTKAIAATRGSHQMLIALNGLLTETIEPIRAALAPVVSQDDIRVWSAPGPVWDLDPRNTNRRKIAEYLREAFLASLEPDVVLITSFFEGHDHDAIT